MRNFPDYIQFYPTIRCNKSCDFCFNKDMPSLPDMTMEQFRKMIVVLESLGIRKLDIIGGEPTLHPDITEMILHAENEGFTVNISSNGTNLPALERISELPNRTSIGLSVNDRNELDALRDYIARRRPIVKSVFRSDMDGIVEDILALRPRRFFILYRDALRPPETGMAAPFDRFLLSIRTRYDMERVGTVFCSGFLSDEDDYSELATVRCPAGTTKLGIMPDGSVYPCNLFFGIEAFKLGNILSGSFERIWRHPRLSSFRTFTKNVCPRTSCELHDACHGGCPAHGLLHCNDLSAPDPRCVRA